jgi:ectoine hydroxylase-related dioxygenase (phytanoyl-CoA dioxygenase family)
MVLYKEKLNLKPPGGSGFAPHLDTPSLRVALGGTGPQTFVTIMVAIDNMTSQNGCLRIAKGRWSEDNHCALVPPEQDGNPDAGGRAGAIPVQEAESFEFVDIACRGGDIVAFNGWAPHRSSANSSPFARRAVFLTYNPASEGDFHDRYYERMDELRNDWRTRVGLSGCCQLTVDEQNDLSALATIPK